MHKSCRNSVRWRGPKGAQLLVPEGIKHFSLAGCFTFSTVAQTVRAAQGMEAAGCRPEDHVGRAWVPKRHSSRLGSPSPLAKELHSTAQDAEGHRGNRTKKRFRAETPGRRGREGGRQTASHTTMVPSHFNATPANMRTRAVQGRGRYAHARRVSSIPTPTRSGAAGNVAYTCDVSPEAVHGPNPFGRQPISGFLRKETHLRLRLPDSGLGRWCQVSFYSGHV